MKKLMLIVLFLFVVSCASRETIRRVDNFTGINTISMNENLLSNKSLKDSPKVYFNLQKVMDGGRVNYAIEIKYIGKKLISVNEGESLLIKFDNKIKTLWSQGSTKYRLITPNGDIYEKAIYPIDKNDVFDLQGAKNIHISLQGTEFTIECFLTKENRENLQSFISEYVN